MITFKRNRHSKRNDDYYYIDLLLELLESLFNLLLDEFTGDHHLNGLRHRHYFHRLNGYLRRHRY